MPERMDIIKKTPTIRPRRIAPRENKAASPQPESKPKKSAPRNNFTPWLLIAILLVVGSVVIKAQVDKAKQTAEGINRQAEEEKDSLRKKLNVLEDKIRSLSEEKTTWDAQRSDYESTAKLLDSARLEFTNEELGISFQYPAIWGDIDLKFATETSGKSYLGKFTKNDAVVFGGTTSDFVGTGTPQAVWFSGYEKKRSAYNADFGDKKDLPIKPVGIRSIGSREVLLLDGTSFLNPADAAYGPGENGQNAIMNLEKENYGGIAFWNMDKTKINSETFDKLIESINIR